MQDFYVKTYAIAIDRQFLLIEMLFMTDKEPTPENIERFCDLFAIVSKSWNSAESTIFAETLGTLECIYKGGKNAGFSPVWQLLASNYIFFMYTGTVPKCKKTMVKYVGPRHKYQEEQL